MMKQIIVEQLKIALTNSPHIAVFYTEETTSTNDWAWDFYANQPVEAETPTLFLANHQQKGRGTQGRTWHSPAGTGLYMTLLIPLPVNQLQRTQFEHAYLTKNHGFTKAAGVATVLALTSLYPWLNGYVGIRKVNDVFLQHRKLGGILVETKLRANGTMRAIIFGIGINILNNDALRIKDERNVAISLEEYAKQQGIDVNLVGSTELGFFIAKHILALYEILEKGQVEDIEALWQELSLAEF
jgi:biotin-[acetyl-CoA-carboxylase] ligase BirA-like protein